MPQSLTKKGFINGFTLKCIAMLTMLLDHVGAVLFPTEVWMRYVGRLAFPIYCFLLAEGAVHTSNKTRYLLRLFLFALISEIPFDLAFNNQIVYLDHQNVFFTLFLGFAAIVLLEKAQSSKNTLFVLLVVPLIWLADLAQTDYGSAGVVIILCFYFLYEQIFIKFAGMFLINTLYQGMNSIQFYASLSIFPLLCYNGKRGPKIKYMFYIFYPAHLFLLYWINERIGYNWRVPL